MRGAKALHDDRAHARVHLVAQLDLQDRFLHVYTELEAHAFRVEYRAVTRRAARTGKWMSYAPGHGPLADRARRLGAFALRLPDETRTLVTQVEQADTRRRIEIGRIHRLLDKMESPHPERLREWPWKRQDVALLRRLRELRHPEHKYARHVDGDVLVPLRIQRISAEWEGAALRGAHARVEQEAAEAGTIPFYAPTYAERLEHASAVDEANMALPWAIRALAAEVLREDARRHEEMRRIRRFLSCAERHAAKRTPDTAWTQRDAALLRRGRRLGADAERCAPHLAGDERSCERFETVRAGLEARALRHAHQVAEREAAEAGILSFYAPGYGPLHDLARTLAPSALPLPADARALAAEVLREDARRHEEMRHIRRFLSCAERHAAKRTPDTAWTRRDAALLRRGRRLGADAEHCAPHLAHDERSCGRFETVRAGLEARALRHAHQVAEREAAEAGILSFYAPGYGPLHDLARTLAPSALPLPDDARVLAERALREDAQRCEEAREVEAFLDTAERRHREWVAGRPRDAQDDTLLTRARAMEADEGPYAPHLDARAFARGRLERVFTVLEPEQHPDDALAAGHVSALTGALGARSDDAGARAFGFPRNDPVPPDDPRLLEEFLAWSEVRELRRAASPDWNAFDDALLDHARATAAARGTPRAGETTPRPGASPARTPRSRRAPSPPSARRSRRTRARRTPSRSTRRATRRCSRGRNSSSAARSRSRAPPGRGCNRCSRKTPSAARRQPASTRSSKRQSIGLGRVARSRDGTRRAWRCARGATP